MSLYKIINIQLKILIKKYCKKLNILYTLCGYEDIEYINY